MARRRTRNSPMESSSADAAPPPEQSVREPVDAHGEKRFGAERTVWRTLALEAREVAPLATLLFVVGAILRFYRLGHADLWLDEVLVYYDAIQGTHVTVSTAHNLHLKIVGWLLHHVSDSPWGLRLFGCTTASLAVPAIVVAARWLRDRQTALAAGLLMALNPFLIFYAQDANYYGTMALLATVQTAFYIAFFRGAPILGTLAICAAGALAHKNHPFATILTAFALGGCALGSFVYPSLRRQVFEWNPKRWFRNPTVPLLIVMGAVAAPIIVHESETMKTALEARLAIGQPMFNVSWSLDFFEWAGSHYLVTFFHNGPLAWKLVWVPFAALAWGVIRLAMNTRRLRPSLPVAGLYLLVLLPVLWVLFNIKHHGFYPRYLSFMVPGFIIAIAFGAAELGDLLQASGKETLRHAGWGVLAAVLAVQLPYLVDYYTTDRSNFIGLRDELQNRHEPGEPVILPAKNIRWQARYYLSKMDPPLWPADSPVANPGVAPDTSILYAEKFECTARSKLLNDLFGVKSAWIVSAWRHNILPTYWEFIDRAIPTVYEGTANGDELMNARLHHWTYGNRALLPHLATRFEDEELAHEGASHWLGTKGGKWRLTSKGPLDLKLEGDGVTVERDGVTVERDGVTVERDGDALIVACEHDRPISVKLDGDTLPGEITAEPIYSSNYRIGPFDALNFVDDIRNSESSFADEPVFHRRFDGFFSYGLWVPSNENRQLVLRAVQRAKDEDKGKGINPKDLFFSVAVDGDHQGVWYLPAGTEERMAEVPLDLKLAPGNHQIDVYGFTPRLGYLPFNDWDWAGMEWNAGTSKTPANRIEELGLNISGPRNAITPWADVIEGGVVEEPYYERSMSNVRGPSGERALAFDLSQKTDAPTGAFHRLSLEPVAAQPGSLFGYSAYARIDANDSFAFQLSTVFFNQRGEVIHIQNGSQQFLMTPYASTWMRCEEWTPIPGEVMTASGKIERVAYVSAGIMVFPPEPTRIVWEGKLYVDSIRAMKNDPGLTAPTQLAEQLIWNPLEKD